MAQAGISALDIVLSGIPENLLVVRGKEKSPVLFKWTTQGEAELSLLEIGRAFHPIVPNYAGQGVVFAKKMHRAVELVGARFGDDIDKAPAGASKFGIGSLGHDHHFRYCVQIKGEGWALSTALFAEERVVEICAIYRDIVVYAALTGNGQFIAVRSLHDAHTRGQQREIEKIAPVVGQVLHGFFGQARGCFALGDINGGSRRFDEDLVHLQCHFYDQLYCLANPHLHPCLTHFCLSLCLYCYVVKTQR